MSEKLIFERAMAAIGKDVIKPERRLLSMKLSVKRKRERRATDPDGDGDVDEPMICGHAAVFNQAADLGYFTEIVKTGAFTRTIGEDDIRALFNHDPNYVLGRNRAGTLRLAQDDIGLAFEVTPGTRSYERDLMENIERGDISQCSIGFYVRGYEVERDGDNWTRTLTDVQLFDVSPVTFPAYTGTDVAVRSLADVIEEFRRGPEGAKTTEEIAVPGLTWEQDLDLRRRLLNTLRD